MAMIEEKRLPLWVTALRDIGFPAAVAFYLLFRLDARLEAMTLVLHEIQRAVTR